MERLKLYAAFVSGSMFMLFVLAVYLNMKLLPQQIQYENKLIKCQSELSYTITKNMNASFRR